MLKETFKGAAAGVLGTAVLNMTTYGDMAIRGRPASQVPDEVARRIASRAHVPLRRSKEDKQAQDNRAQGLGALMGYVAGAAVGAAYGAMRSRGSKSRLFQKKKGKGASTLLASPVIAAAAMLAGDTPTVATGIADPRDWGVEAWTMHAVPHFLYGVTTAAAFEAMNGHK